jgi:hypothetical protein
MTRTTLLLIAVLVGGVQFAEGQAVPRAVSGRVFDDTTGCPLAGVQIQAVGGTGRAVTNTQGRYRLAALPDGDVVVQAAKTGYRPLQTLPLTVSDSAVRADFSLIRATGDSAARAAYPRKTCQLEPVDRQ